MQKVVVILGQTSAGKSDLAVKVAKRWNGEIISADSRQVYKGLDLGSGKITKKEMKGVPHHLLDVVSLNTNFTVARYKQLADKKIKETIKRGKLPIICGGTGFYIDAVVKGMVLPEVPPNKKLREELATKSNAELLKILVKLDKERAKNIDQHNTVRLIRAIEVAKALGKVPEIKYPVPKYEFIKVGLKMPQDKLKRKIRTRLRKRLRGGMAIELYDLKKKGVSWDRFLKLGFDQKFVALFLQKKLGDKELLEALQKGSLDYSKRQLTWFKRDKDIKWFDMSTSKNKDVVSYIDQKLKA